MEKGNSLVHLKKEDPTGLVSGLRQGPALGEIYNFRLTPKVPDYGNLEDCGFSFNANNKESGIFERETVLKNVMGPAEKHTFKKFVEDKLEKLKEIHTRQFPFVQDISHLGYDFDVKKFYFTLYPFSGIAVRSDNFNEIFGFLDSPQQENPQEFQNKSDETITIYAKETRAPSSKMSTRGVFPHNELVIALLCFPFRRIHTDNFSYKLTIDRVEESLNLMIKGAAKAGNLKPDVCTVTKVGKRLKFQTPQYNEEVVITFHLNDTIGKILIPEDPLTFLLTDEEAVFADFLTPNLDLLEDLHPVYLSTNLTNDLARTSNGTVNLTAVCNPGSSFFSNVISDEIPTPFALATLFDKNHKEIKFSEFDAVLCVDIMFNVKKFYSDSE